MAGQSSFGEIPRLEGAVDILDIDSIVEKLLALAGITEPPVDPCGVIRALKVETASVSLPGNLQSMSLELDDFYLLYVNTDTRPERLSFRIAHEIFEVLLGDVPRKERTCNLAASALLMPTAWFAEACKRTGFNLFELKALFRTASHEAVAYRTLSFREAVVTVADHGEVTSRVGSAGFSYPRELQAIERRALERAMEAGEAVRESAEGIVVEGWPVFEEGWKRVILITSTD